jgi:hypothetical protein
MLASEMCGGNLRMICKDRLSISSVYLSIPNRLKPMCKRPVKHGQAALFPENSLSGVPVHFTRINVYWFKLLAPELFF